jgi:hypothetical protein
VSYVKFNVNTELRKAAQGKKTKVPVGILLHIALKDYPVIQKRVAAAFSITTNE